MSRIQQILSKAERDGTARRMIPDGDRAGSVPQTPAAVVDGPAAHQPGAHEDDEADEPRADHRAIGSVEYRPASVSSQAAVEAVLDPVLVAALQPQSPAAEQYRSLRARIAQLENGSALRVIQITSPGKYDGKTVTALNLALTMAQEFQRRVLVLDADLRQPRVHQLLGLEAGPGLVDVLTGTATLDEALLEIPEYHLTVLRAGRAYERPAEMLGSGPMRRLVDTLRTEFDRIVVDSAPAMVSDPGAVAALVDGLLLVVRASATTKPAISRAIATLGSSRLLGLVLNESGAPLQEQYGAGA
jgi:receptor protein-tyrosine kinase/non-specific protein-tyrosine kinase